MRLTIFILLIVLLISCNDRCFAAQPDTANPYSEINRVIGMMNSSNHLSFNAVYYLEQSTAAGIIRDTVAGSYKINGANYYAQLDSTIILQNGAYNMSLSKPDSMMIISRAKTVFPAVMRTDVLDPRMQSSYFTGTILSDSANTRKIQFVMNAVSPYTTYELVYDTITYRMSSLKYKQKHYGTEANNSSYYTLIRVVFSNYQLNAFTDSVFDTSVYFTRQNAAFIAVAPYGSFQIYNQVLNQ